jgi:hypothetical protein
VGGAELAAGAVDEAAGAPDEAVTAVAAPSPEPPQAATSRPMAISRGSRGWGTAAL